jgi:hypothetical protein
MARDILGLGGPDAYKSNSDRPERSIASESDREKRRRRMNEGADELTPEPTGMDRGSGATGIDMGSGGEGTDLE